MSSSLSALDFVASCLALGSSAQRNKKLRFAITSGQVDWEAVLRIANDQLVSPALWVALRRRNLATNLPDDVRKYLYEIHRLNRDRNEGLRLQALEALRSLNALGVVPVLLKGAISLFSEIYDDPGSRVMLDLDILVPQDKAQDCWNKLRELGYSPLDCKRDFSCHHHLEPLQRLGGYGTIEIHRRAFSEKAERIVPPEWIWTRCRPMTDAGVAFCVPDPTFQVLHNVLHAAVDHGGFQRASGSLRSLHELALTATLYRDSIDWKQLRDFFERGSGPNVLTTWQALAHRLFGGRDQSRTGTFGTVFSLIYCLRYRLQARWTWIDASVARMLLFSDRNIQERYAGDDAITSVGAGRIRLLRDVFGHYGRQITRRIWRYMLGVSS